MTFIDRMLDERSELTIKLNALMAFMKTDEFLRIPIEHRQLMFEQRFVMAQYIEILNNRIKLATLV